MGGNPFIISVKDNTNIAEYNIWSGSDYLNNTTGINGGHTNKVSSSSDFSTKGNKSFKINFDETSFLYINFIGIDVVPDETYNISMKVYNNSGQSMKLNLIELNNSHSQSVTVDSSDSVQTISITNFVATSTGQLKVQVNNNTQIATVYIDDITLVKV